MKRNPKTNSGGFDVDSPLKTAYRLQELATCSGLDWPEAGQIWSVINDELAEAKSAIEDPSVLAKRLALRTHKRSESCPDGQSFERCLQESLGKLLFAVVDICRKFDIDPDLALDSVNEEFNESFEYVRKKSTEKGLLMGLQDRKTISKLWQEAKHHPLNSDKISPFPAGSAGIPVRSDEREALHIPFPGIG